MRISDWSSDVCSSDLLAGAAAFAVRRKAMGIDDGRAALALAQLAAQCERLPEGKEAVGREAVGDHGVPEDQNVDPGITIAGLAVARPVYVRQRVVLGKSVSVRVDLGGRRIIKK